MAAKGELVAYAAQFPDLEFSVDDDLTDGDPEFAWLETGWMMHDFEHKVASGAILPKLRPLGLAPHTAPGAGSGVKPVEMASGLQEFPIHQLVSLPNRAIWKPVFDLPFVLLVHVHHHHHLY